MSKRFYKFLIVWISTFSFYHGYSQISTFTFPTQRSFFTLALPDSLKNAVTPLILIRKDHYVKNLAFFCRQEVRFEKSFRLPLRFRMGSVQQCDYLEGKK